MIKNESRALIRLDGRYWWEMGFVALCLWHLVTMQAHVEALMNETVSF